MKNRFLSLGWFLEKLNLEQKKDKAEEAKPEKPERLFVAIKLVNSALSVVLTDGNILSKPNATEEDYQGCLNATTREEIEFIISDTKHVAIKKEEKREPEEIITKEVVKTITKGFEALSKLKDFRVDGDVVYWGKIRRSMPQQLIVALCKLVEGGGFPLTEEDLEVNDQYLSLKKFWLKCCLNPNSQSAEDLYTFLSNHKFKIDRHGNFYAYRRVRSKGSSSPDKDLLEFVSNSYTKVKAVWKYNPNRFVVIRTEDGHLGINDTKKKSFDPAAPNLGNLAELYTNLSKTSGEQYTSAHTGQEDYRIGEVISMPRDEGDSNNNVSCSTGFHAASKKYDYSGFGDTPILMIINPMDVLSVPKGEVGKLRTCRWFFACVLSEKEKYILDEDKFDVTNLGDIFEEKIHQNLEKDIRRGFSEEIKRHKFYVPSVNEEDIKVIVKSLDDMQKEIKSRIKKI